MYRDDELLSSQIEKATDDINRYLNQVDVMGYDRMIPLQDGWHLTYNEKSCRYLIYNPGYCTPSARYYTDDRFSSLWEAILFINREFVLKCIETQTKTSR